MRTNPLNGYAVTQIPTMSSVLRAAAAVAGSASVLIMLRKAEEYPIAFHEAGHSVVASHLEFCGLDARTAAGERHRGRLRIEAPSLVRFATIVPRVTAAGEYVGETKLTVRWRHMAAHTDWEPGAPATAVLTTASLSCTLSTVALLSTALLSLSVPPCCAGTGAGGEGSEARAASSDGPSCRRRRRLDAAEIGDQALTGHTSLL